jgi:hypothetical protein
MELSLAKLGQLTPVQAWSCTKDGLELFDGIKRWRAAQALSWPRLRVEVHALDAPGAKARLLRCNVAAGLSALWRPPPRKSARQLEALRRRRTRGHEQQRKRPVVA